MDVFPIGHPKTWLPFSAFCILRVHIDTWITDCTSQYFNLPSLQREGRTFIYQDLVSERISSQSWTGEAWIKHLGQKVFRCTLILLCLFYSNVCFTVIVSFSSTSFISVNFKSFPDLQRIKKRKCQWVKNIQSCQWVQPDPLNSPFRG